MLLAVGTVVYVLAWVGLVVVLYSWGQGRKRKKAEQQEAPLGRAEESARTHLYENLSIEEAQRIVWAWEEMTDAERAELSIERRVDIRKIREDLAAHRKQWGQT